MIHIVIAIIVALSIAQRSENFEGFISGMRANAVKGEVFYVRGDGSFNLETGHKLQEGDFIKTGSSSYAELLLQPGSYLRVGGDSELQIFSDAYDKMRLKLNRGSITFEILAIEGEVSSNFDESLSQTYPLIRVITPNAQVFITRSGIFRINCFGTEHTEVIARDGEAVINGRLVKQKRSGVVSSQGVAIVEIDSKLEDDFDAWARVRADKLIRANKLLKNESPWAKHRKEGNETSVDFPEEEKQIKSQRYVVSAKPGAVNFVEAGVDVRRATKDWEPLTEKTQLENGDRARTSPHTFAEISLLPDISLRIDGQSEILFEQLSHEGISMKLVRGSAILDVARFKKKEVPPIALAGVSTSVVIADAGNYRIDILPNRDEIMVREGKVIFEERSVSSCRKIISGTVSECNRKRNDNFDVWSEHRGEGKLYDGREVISMAAHLERLRQSRFRDTGFWYQTPGTPDYTFVPFSFTGYRSPYGGSYSTVLSPRRRPRIRRDLRDRPPGPQIGRPPR